MTSEQQKQISRLRHQKCSYSKIAAALSLPKNTVQSYCRRNSLSSDGLRNTAKCKQCGKTIILKEKCKPRQFCSDKCRIDFWKAIHKTNRSRTAYTLICSNCKATFTSDGDKRRKYCSHQCYINDRFGKERYNG